MNCNQSTVILKNTGGKEVTVTEIPDLWHLAMAITDLELYGDERDGRARNAILEVWHQAHNLKDAITQEGEAEIIHVIDPNDLHAVVNYDEDPSDSEEKQTGYVAIYNSNRIEIPLSIGDLYAAKCEAIRILKVPKSKQGLLAIAPGYGS